MEKLEKIVKVMFYHQPRNGPSLKSLLTAVVAVTLINLLSCADNTTHTLGDTVLEKRTRTGKTIIIAESHPLGRSLSTIEVRTQGFEHDFHSVYEDMDPVSKVFVVDLDDNGFDEVYIISTSADSGSYGTVLGFSSNRDKSLSMIHFPKIRPGDKTFEGYMGHDTFDVLRNKIVRIFPVYNYGDANENPTGGKKILEYGLYPGEAVWELKIERQEKLEQRLAAPVVTVPAN
ncbi:MAG: hypothetical protein V2I36_18640 [Desulfopila sp.]|nr:hypothetical protein [Desulfopila sp.]